MPSPSEQDQSLERKVLTVLSCRIVGLPGSEIAAPQLGMFVPQAVTILQIMSARVHLGAASVLMAEFANHEMSETDAERAVLAAFDLLSAKRDNPESAGFGLCIGIASGLIWAKIPEAGAGDDSSVGRRPPAKPHRR